MDTLKLYKLTYKFQDLLFQNKMPTLKNFKIKVCKDFFIPISQLEKIYVFIETIQQHPKQYSLIHVLGYVFKMVLVDMISIGCSKRYIIEHIVELKLRPELLSSEFSAVYKDENNNNIASIGKNETIILPDFYKKKENVYLFIPKQFGRFRIKWNIWIYLLRKKILILQHPILQHSILLTQTANFIEDIEKTVTIFSKNLFYEMPFLKITFNGYLKDFRQIKAGYFHRLC